MEYSPPFAAIELINKQQEACAWLKELFRNAKFKLFLYVRQQKSEKVKHKFSQKRV